MLFESGSKTIVKAEKKFYKFFLVTIKNMTFVITVQSTVIVTVISHNFEST